MSYLSHLGDILLWALTVFAFIAYLFAVFSIVGDLFRDTALGGGVKALWLIFLFFLPFITALVYVIARGRGMADRAAQQAQRQREATERYIRSVAAGTPDGPEQIAFAKQLLDEGTITAEEFERLKASVMSTLSA